MIKTNNKQSVCVIAVAKHEKNYIIEWVKYYLNVLNVDKIILYDNNDDSDDEILAKILKDYIYNYKVKVVSVRNKRINQSLLYNEAYNRYSQYYNWLCFFDIDEYLVMNNNMTFNEWLNSISKNTVIDEIFVNWKIFDDNDLIEYDSRPVMERFTREYVEDKTPENNPEYFIQTKGQYYYIRDNYQIKSIVRGKNRRLRYMKNFTHKFMFKNGVYVDSDLKPVNFFEPNKYSINHITYNNCQLNHYIQKTISEYIERARCRSMKHCKIYTNGNEIKRNFMRFNKWTDEKEKILKQYLKQYENSSLNDL